MLAGSVGVIARRFPEYSVAALLFVVVLQGLGYGLLFDLSFFLRNLSVVGGLLMVLSDSLATKKKLFAGLPQISETDRRKYVQLAGRILLIFLFVGFIFQGNWSIARVFVCIIGLGACIMVAVGFKAKWSASFLVLLLSVFNVLVNKWWSVHPAHPQRDFLKYDFFQTLSIVGGLLLLVNMGPGGISVDEKKKVRVRLAPSASRLPFAPITLSRTTADPRSTEQIVPGLRRPDMSARTGLRNAYIEMLFAMQSEAAIPSLLSDTNRYQRIYNNAIYLQTTMLHCHYITGIATQCP